MSELVVLFIPECFADTTLLYNMLIPKQLLNHQKGITNVAKIMQNSNNLNKYYVGLIDNDKITPRYFDEFDVVESYNNITLKKSKTLNHYIIVLTPAFEQWILKCAEQAGIDATKFNLPDDPKELHKVTEKLAIGPNQNFTNFLKAIKRANPPSIVALNQIISFFWSPTY